MGRKWVLEYLGFGCVLGRFELDPTGYVVFSGHPQLRLLMAVGPETGSLKLLDRVSLDGALPVGFSIDEDDDSGTVSGIYTTGVVVKMASLLLAKFFNAARLTAVAPHIYRAEAAALLRALAPPLEKGLGRVMRGSLE